MSQPDANLVIPGHEKIAEPGMLLMLGIALAVSVELLENQLFVFSANPIQAGIHASQFEYSMIALAYAVTAICMIFTQGHWVRLWGYRRFLIGSLILFVAAGVACTLTTNVWQLGFTRLLQGVGGGALFTTTRVLLQTQIPAKRRVLAVRIFLLGVFGPSALAPFLAGKSIEAFGWQAIFWLPIPLALLAITFIGLALPRKHGRVHDVAPSDLPMASIGLVMLGIFGIELALTEFRFNYFSGFGHIPLLLMIGVGLAWYFVLHQSKHKQSLLRVHELGNASYLMGLFFYFWYYFLSNSNAFVFPLFLEKTLGYSFVTAGLILTIASLFGLMVLLAYFHYSARIKSKRPFMIIALIAMSIYGFSMSVLPADASFMHISILTMMRSVFTILLAIPLAALVFSELDEEIFAHGYQTKNILRQLSATFAVSVSAVMLENPQIKHVSTMTEHISLSNPHWAQYKAKMAAVLANIDGLKELTLEQIDIYRQALFMACEDIFRWQGICAVVILVILLVQKRLR